MVAYEPVCAKWDAAIRERYKKHKAAMEAAQEAAGAEGGGGDDA